MGSVVVLPLLQVTRAVVGSVGATPSVVEMTLLSSTARTAVSAVTVTWAVAWTLDAVAMVPVTSNDPACA